MNKKRKQSLGEEIANAITHGVGLGLSIAGLVILILSAREHGTPWHLASYLIYGATLIALYLASTLYHSFPEGKVKRLFRIFDHSAIFLLIAGTYTPVILAKIKGTFGFTVLTIIWSLALLGIVFKALFINRFRKLSTIIYLGMGWLALVLLKPLLTSISTASAILFFGGGLFYTLGTVFYSRKKMKYSHAVWHGFVLAGSICHFFMVLNF